MGIGPFLVIRGTILGSVIIGLFSWLITAGISLPAQARAESIPAQSAAQPVVQEAVAQDAVVQDYPTVSCSVSAKYSDKILQWCDLISKYAEKNGLPPDLVAALIVQESGGNASAYSHSGAVGLMQVMPRDGLAASFMCKNGPCFSGRPSSNELFDPEFNIKYGTKMLAGLLNRNGNIREALRAYGPMDAGYSYADKVLGIYERYRQ